MTRSLWKGPVMDIIVEKKLEFLKNKQLDSNYNNYIRTKARNVTIRKDFIGKFFYVYNGKSYTKIYIQAKMVGFKLGSFSITRKRCIHKVKRNKKK